MNAIAHQEIKAMTQAQDDATPSRPRTYNIGGCFSLVATLVARANRPNPEAPVSLLQSWLPLSAQRMVKNDVTTFRVPGVIPALAERSYRRLAPSIDAYAAERDWVVQPVVYFYRPKALVDVLGEDGKIKDLGAIVRNDQTKDRLLIDATVQTEVQMVLRDLLDVCLRTLEEAGIAEPSYMQESDHARVLLNSLLSDFPFLVHHIFKAYPKLHLLRHRGRINGREDTVHHIRYSRDAIYEIDSERMMRENVLNVVA